MEYRPEKLFDFVQDGLVSLAENEVSVSEAGRLIVRNIAMAFDPALKTGAGVYSKTV